MPRGPQIHENRGLKGVLGSLFFGCGASWSQFSDILRKVGVEMLKVASKMGQDGVKMAILGPTCEVLERSWPDFGRFWDALGSIFEALCGMGGSVKTNNRTAFL